MTAPVQVSDVIAGKYAVERVLARGGMGVVVAARHLQLDQRVALKFMLSELLVQGYEPEAIARFLREGRAIARLRGENVARVLDVGTLDEHDGDGSGRGTPYMVMEFLEGIDLKDLVIERGPLPVQQAVDYVLQASVAMAEAHCAGIVHRDLKPDNLFLTRRPDGSPLIKVLDFGISKLYEPGDHELGVGRTHGAVVMGSPAYMAPEQARSARDVDLRADIWSLGVILYELTSRRLPYNSNVATAELLAQLIYQPPYSLEKAAPHLPRAFCSVVHRCLAKQADDRFQNVAEMAEALGPFATGAGRACLTPIRAMIANPGSQATRGYADMGDQPTEPWLDAPAVPKASIPAGGADVLAALERPGPLALSSLDNPGQVRRATLLSAAPPAPEVLSPAHTGPVIEVDMAASGAEPVGVGHAALSRPQPAGMNDPLVTAGGGIIEHDLGPMRRLPAAQTPVRPPPSISARSRAEMAQPWLDPQRIVHMAVVLVIGLLTVAIAVFGTERVLIDQIDNALHKLGYRLFASAGYTVQLLGGTIVQLALPLLLALILLWREYRFAAVVCLWWLGENLIHIARYVADAPVGLRMPIVGGTNTWTHLLSDWWLLGKATEIARVVHLTGLAVMLAMFALLVYWSVRRR
ncbi:MAG: protein kinase [Proteobacteria bacterium]|nr:protein kinase [Pseudomonadota bacterium]